MATILALLLHYKYLVLIPAAIIEGPIVALIGGFLAHNGVFNFWVVYVTIIASDILADSFSYYVGHRSRQAGWVKKRLARSEILVHHLDVIDRLWQEHTHLVLFLAKLAYGLTFPFLVTAGMVRMSYKKFITNSISIMVFQYLIIMGIGYGSGALLEKTVHYLDLTYILVAVIVLLIVSGYFLIAAYARRKIKSILPSE